MFVRCLPTIALLVGLPLALADCGSDTSDGGSAGSTAAAGKAGAAASAGESSVGGSGGGGSAAVAGSGNASAGGASGGSAGSAAGSSSGGAGASSGGVSGATTAGGSGAGNSAGAAGKAGGGNGGGPTGAFALTSPDHAEGAKFAKDYTCDAMNGTFGSGVNPELDWSAAPSGTLSFAITFIDTTLATVDPNDSKSQHWASWNIPATVMKFPKATGMTLSGDLAMAKQSGKFLTPCAQSLMNGMDDQYEFTVYALSSATLNVTGTSVANVLAALKTATVLGKATLHGHAGLKGK